MDKENNLSVFDLLKTLSTSDHMSIPMLYQLSDLSPEEMENFCTAWPEIDEERRRVIVRHLADISEENYQVDFTDVFGFCLSDKSKSVRLASLDGLWDTERLALIGPIVNLMQSDPEVEVRTLAAATLGHFVLIGEWQQIPYKFVEPIVEALIEQLDRDETDHSVKRASLESLGAATHPRVAGLIEDAYSSGDEEMLASAIFAMGRSADSRWLHIVKDEMMSPFMELRIESARAAGSIGSSEFIPALSDLLWDDDLEVRLAAVAALGEIGGDTASRILEDLIEDPEAVDIHLAAMEALEEISWFGDEIDLSLFDWENDFDNNGFPSA